MIDTKNVTGRRALHFNSLEEALADAESLASGSWRQLGNWSLGQIAGHLAISLDNTVDNREFKAPWFVRLMMPFMKNSFITKPMSPGFKMPDGMKPLFMPPDDISTDDGVAALRTAVARFVSVPSLPDRSATLGKMTRDQWNQFHCRHAEMHLSFIVPA